MAKSRTTLKKGDNLPARGRSKHTLILEAIREKGLLSLKKGATNDDAEKAVFGFLAEAAFNPTEDTAQVSTVCLTQLMKKGWADVKPTHGAVNFTLDERAKPHEKASQILKAVSSGDVSPDIGALLIGAISSMMKIEEVTEIKKELDKIKEMLGLSNE